jgi:hypothetical protein
MVIRIYVDHLVLHFNQDNFNLVIVFRNISYMTKKKFSPRYVLKIYFRHSCLIYLHTHILLYHYMNFFILFCKVHYIKTYHDSQAT